MESLQKGGSVYLLPDFYDKADLIRSQFQGKFSVPSMDHDGMTQLVYAYSESKYQFLTASADHFFTPDVIEDLMTRIRDWGKDELGTQNISTPQTRVYITGCYRGFLVDGVRAQWHYTLSISGERGRRSVGVFKVLANGSRHEGTPQFGIGLVTSAHMSFNQLLVHPAKAAYSVELGKKSMNPSEADIYLDGYLW